MARKAVLTELQSLVVRNGGTVTPHQVVDFARDPSTALHNQFEWRNTAAAEKWRLHQARNLLRVFVEVIENHEPPVRMFVSLGDDRNTGGGYRETAAVLRNPRRREQLLLMALRDMDIFTTKYRALHELADVFAAMRSVRGKRKAM